MSLMLSFSCCLLIVAFVFQGDNLDRASATSASFEFIDSAAVEPQSTASIQQSDTGLSRKMSLVVVPCSKEELDVAETTLERFRESGSTMWNRGEGIHQTIKILDLISNSILALGNPDDVQNADFDLDHLKGIDRKSGVVPGAPRTNPTRMIEYLSAVDREEMLNSLRSTSGRLKEFRRHRIWKTDAGLDQTISLLRLYQVLSKMGSSIQIQPQSSKPGRHVASSNA